MDSSVSPATCRMERGQPGVIPPLARLRVGRGQRKASRGDCAKGIGRADHRRGKAIHTTAACRAGRRSSPPKKIAAVAQLHSTAMGKLSAGNLRGPGRSRRRKNSQDVPHSLPQRKSCRFPRTPTLPGGGPASANAAPPAGVTTAPTAATAPATPPATATASAKPVSAHPRRHLPHPARSPQRLPSNLPKARGTT